MGEYGPEIYWLLQEAHSDVTLGFLNLMLLLRHHMWRHFDCVCVFLPPLRHTEKKKLSLSFLKDTTALEWHRLLSRLPTIIGYSSVFFSRTATNLPHSASYKMAFQQLAPFVPYHVVCINKWIENENSNLFPECYCIGIGKRLLNYKWKKQCKKAELKWIKLKQINVTHF